MSRWTSAHVIVVLALAAAIMSLLGCAASPEQTTSSQMINQAAPTVPDVTSNDGGPISDEVEITSLQQLPLADLIIEGTIAGEQTRWITDTTATNTELADRQARGLPMGVYVTDYQVTLDKVLHGQVAATTITVVPTGAKYKVGDRVILFLTDISGDPVQASGQTKYQVIASDGQFRIEKDNTLSSHRPKGRYPLADTYRGKGKDILEKDIQDLVAQLPKPTKTNILQNALGSAEIVIEGTIQGVRDVHFVNSMEKSQQEIDQMLAEGKMPGLVLTDYTITVDKVLFDMRSNNLKFFSNWKPLEPGQTIIVTRQGGTYRGVTEIEEPGPAFELGSREVLFLVGTSLLNYDLPDDGQSRYSTHSRQGRLLIEPNNRLTAFTQKGPGGIYGGQSLEELEQDIAQFLKEHPSASEGVPTPSRP